MTLLVPYRDREEHLKEFVPHINLFLPQAKVLIIEQTDDKPFNRGKLINAGFLESCDNCYCAHDVDMIPILHIDYPERRGVTQIAKSEIQTNDYLGGVTIFDSITFQLFGGYHNDYFHRAEDNELMFHLKRLGIKISQPAGVNFFQMLPHPRTGPDFIPELWQKAQLPRTKDMLKTCEYRLISKEVKDGYTLIKVLL